MKKIIIALCLVTSIITGVVHSGEFDNQVESRDCIETGGVISCIITYEDKSTRKEWLELVKGQVVRYPAHPDTGVKPEPFGQHLRSMVNYYMGFIK